MKWKPIPRAAAMLSLCLSLLCPGLALAAEPFSGIWEGTWEDLASHKGGEAAISVWPDGTVLGVIGNTIAKATGAITGTRDANGGVHLRYSYDNGQTVYRAEGTLAIAPDGHLKGETAFIDPRGVRFAMGAFDLANPNAANKPAAAQQPPAAAAPPAAAPAAANQGGGGGYTPLPNDQPSGTGAGRVAWVHEHPSGRGTPAACQGNWEASGPQSHQCADALFAQAEAERAAGDCVGAMTDYDNTRQAAQNAGLIMMFGLKEGDGRTFCANKLHPPKPTPGVSWGKPGVMPIGRYTCSSAAAVIAAGGAFSSAISRVGQFEGYIWIFDDHRYAAPDQPNDAGVYRMQGDTMIAIDGPYGPKRDKTEIAYFAKGLYGRPTIQVGFVDNGKVSTAVDCTHDGPPN